ncbi:MAG: ZIP family metal transporter [Clostridiaceae bacterium]
MQRFSTFTWISIFALSAMLVNSLGIWFIYKHREWAEKSKEYFMCFAAGVLITSPLIMAFPQAVAKNPDAGLAALTGFIFMFFSNRFIKNRTKQPELAFGITALGGIGIHSFIDGIIYSVTFSASTLIGVLAGVGLVAHEFAEGIITFSFLVKGGISAKKAIVYAFLVASLTTPVGAFIAYPFVSNLNDAVLGLALGFVVGVLIYVSASHLLPETRKNERPHSYLVFLAGIMFSLLLFFIK